MSAPVTTFGPEASAPDNKRAAKPKLAARKAHPMLNTITEAPSHNYSAKDTVRVPNGLVHAPALPFGSYMEANGREVTRIKHLLDARFADVERLARGRLVSEVITITPAQAEYILETYNTGNRPVTPNKVHRYAAAIRDGRFRLTSQGISFARNRRLMNGQHRLLAIVESGCPLSVLVVFGEDPDVFDVLDAGEKRTTADALAIKGYKFSQVLSASARLLYVIERGRRSDGHNLRADTDVLVSFIKENAGLENFMAQATAAGKKTKTPAPPLGVAFYLIEKHSADPDEFLSDFIEQLTHGRGIEGVVHRLREGLIEGILVPKAINGTSRNVAIAAAIIKGWNALGVRGRPSLQWKPGESFPVAK